MSDLTEWIKERRTIHENATQGGAWETSSAERDAFYNLPALLTAVEKVLERHRPVRGETRRSPDVCAECDELIGEPGYDCGGVVDWPCPTIQDLSLAIEGAIQSPNR